MKFKNNNNNLNAKNVLIIYVQNILFIQKINYFFDLNILFIILIFK